jgi:hypothetical protein
LSYFPAAVAQGSRDRLLIAEFKNEIQFQATSVAPKLLAKWRIDGLKPTGAEAPFALFYIFGAVLCLAKVSGNEMTIRIEASKDDATYTQENVLDMTTTLTSYAAFQKPMFDVPQQGGAYNNTGTLYLRLVAFNSNGASTNFLKLFRAAISLVLTQGATITRLL